MGVSIYWAPLAKQHDITPGSRSAFAALLEREGLYGELTERNATKLITLAAYQNDDEFRRALVEIVVAIKKHGTVVVGRAY